MGLFDGLLGKLFGSKEEGNPQQADLPQADLPQVDPQHADLLNSVLGMVTNSQTGGIGGILSAFQSGGLGHLVQSWISTGENLPVSGQQIEDVLGGDKIDELAQSSGLSTDVIKFKLTEFLPMIVDKLTPNGTIPE